MKDKSYIKKIIEEIIFSYNNELILSIDKSMEIDFVDIFPKNEIERKEISNFLNRNAVIIEKDNKGDFYLLNDKIKTIYGILEIVKLRVFDINKDKRGTIDFKCSNYGRVKLLLEGKKDVYTIKRTNDELIEIPIEDNYIYISNKPKSNDYQAGLRHNLEIKEVDVNIQ